MFRIGEFAQIAQVSGRQLRFYDQLGLLQPRIGDYDVVVKQVAATPFLSLRYTCDDIDEAVRMVRSVAEDGIRLIRATLRDKLIVVARNDYDDETLDLEIGYSLTRASNANVRIVGNLVPTASELPAVDTMATIVRSGTNAASHCAFGSIGMWIEANGYEVSGPCREVFLEPLTGPPGFEGALVEIQFPVRQAA
jgi:effector-binding domain-containing protein